VSFLTRRIVISVDGEIAIVRRIAALFARSPAPDRKAVEVGPLASPSATASAYLDELDARFGFLPAESADAGDAPFDTLLMDGSAVVALASGDAPTRTYLRAALARGANVTIAASALADPRVAALAQRVAAVIDVDDRAGNEAARLISETRLRLPLDALNVACAPAGLRVAILTADPAGLGALVRATGRSDLNVIRVGARLRRG
jgi:hypothetical protein